MPKYLKSYRNLNDYTSDYSNLVLPNVSAVKDGTKYSIKYNPVPFIKYTTTDGNDILSEFEETLSQYIDQHIANEEDGYYIIKFTNNLTTFPQKVLYKSQTLKTIEFHNFFNITSINHYFIANCPNLESADFSGFPNVTEIKDQLLYECSLLKYVNIKAFTKLQKIGNNFIANNILETIDLSSLYNVAEIGSNFLTTCRQLTYLDLSVMTNLTKISNNFIYNEKSLETVILPDLTEFTATPENFIFSCTSLKTIKNLETLRNVTTLGRSFLYGASALVEIDLSFLKDDVTVVVGFLQDARPEILKMPAMYDVAYNAFKIDKLRELHLTGNIVSKNIDTFLNRGGIRSELKIYVIHGLFDNYKAEYPDYVDRFICMNDDTSEHKYELIDMGLSVDWAVCNVGADSPEGYGWYFSFGDPEPYKKDGTSVNGGPSTKFSITDYKWCNGSGNSMTKYCGSASYGTVDNKEKLDPEDDPATVHMGLNWRSPTGIELQQLQQVCDEAWVTNYNGTGISGITMTLKTDPSKVLFFPAGHGDYTYGRYWTNSVILNNSDDASFYTVNSSGLGLNRTPRHQGFCVRGVKSKHKA